MSPAAGTEIRAFWFHRKLQWLSESQCFGGRLVPLTQFFVFERDLCLGVPRALKSDKLSHT